MKETRAKSAQAAEAYALVSHLQEAFCEGLNRISRTARGQDLEPVHWFRNEGANGGGLRLCTADGAAFQRASINVSQVHYDSDAKKKLASATALSAIVHPTNPHAPSMHLHVSWTEYKSGLGYWRIMADLNPSIADESDGERFGARLKRVAPEHYATAIDEGNRYFEIPALERHRGILHYYLEGFHTVDAAADKRLANEIAGAAIEVYLEIVNEQLTEHNTSSVADRDEQLAYHTLYFFQVLTLDRGTTTGLLVHDQNDLGILGSLPAFVDGSLLADWKSKLPEPQNQLVERLLIALGEAQPAPIDDAAKLRLAKVLREHYKANPGALDLQASAAIRPPSVDNHR